VRRVLERALHIDARTRAAISLSELQRIGAEIGISPESIARAVAELGSEEDERVRSAARFRRRLYAWARTMVSGAAAFVAGTVVGHQNDVASFLLFVLIAVASLYYERRRKIGDYLRDMIGVAAGFGAGWFVASGMPNNGDTTWHLIVPGITGIAAGWILVQLERALRSQFRRESNVAGQQTINQARGYDRPL
jgi:hypothetical protein